MRTRYWVPGTTYSVLHTRYCILDTAYSILGTRYFVLLPPLTTHNSLFLSLSYQRKLAFLVFFVGIGAAVGGRSIGFALFLFPDGDLSEEGVDHFAFFDVPDDLTAFEDAAF